MTSAGFSLLELLIVIIISAILATVGLNCWQDIKLRNELTSSTQQLLRFLNEIKLDANIHNINNTLHLFHNKDQSWCIAVTPELRPKECNTQFKFKLDNNHIEIAGISEISTLAFYGRRNMAQTATIRLKNNIAESRIIISVQGRIRYCSYRSFLSGFPKC